MANPSNVRIPEDVMVEILLRLPVKPLSRFKCVCTNWCALIESASFVDRHFGHESNQERLLIRHYKPDEGKHAFALYVDEVFSRYEEPVHLQMPETVKELLGPVNGVFCVVGVSGQIALLNPAMRQFKPLPLFIPKSPPHRFHVCVLGFGLDLSSGDYKLVAIHFFLDNDLIMGYPSLASVYNSASDSWRHLEEADLVTSNRMALKSLSNTYLNGVYYWLMECNKTNGVGILAFDFSNEKFQEIRMPDYGNELKEWDLALYGESIAMVSSHFKNDKCIDVWVLGKEGCWTKNVIVGPFEDVEWAYPLSFWKENELLLEMANSPYLNLYDVYTKKLTTIEAHIKGCDGFTHRVFSYKESLVSLQGWGNKCKMWNASSDFVKDFLK